MNCNTEKRTFEYGHIDLEIGFQSKEFFRLSEVAVDVEYVFLETNDDCLLADIRNIVYDPPYFFVTDRFEKTIFIFNETGRYINKISAVGQGPHEYTEIYNFDAKNNCVHILDYNLRKIFTYDISGKFINDLKVDARTSFLKISFENDLILASSNHQIKSNEGFVFSQYDNDLNLKRKFHPMEDNGFKTNSTAHSFYRHKDNLIYWEWNIFDTIYNILPDGHAEARFIIHPGKIPSSHEQPYEKAHLVEFKQFDISRLVETDNYLFLFCVYNKTAAPLIYSKSENKIIGIEMSLANDIDGGISFWPTYKLSDNKVCTARFPYEIKTYLNIPIAVYNKGFRYEAFRPKLDYNVEKHKKLLEQLAKTDDMSNPVLMIITMKSNSNHDQE